MHMHQQREPFYSLCTSEGSLPSIYLYIIANAERNEHASRFNMWIPLS